MSAAAHGRSSRHHTLGLTLTSDTFQIPWPNEFFPFPCKLLDKKASVVLFCY